MKILFLFIHGKNIFPNLQKKLGELENLASLRRFKNHLL